MTKPIEKTEEIPTQLLENKLVEILDQLQEGVVKIGDTAVKYSPDIADVLLWVVRLDGITTIVYGLLSILTCYFSMRFWKYARKLQEEYGRDSEATAPYLLSVGFGSITLFISVHTWLNFWNWVQIFAPELFLAKQLISQVIGL